MGEPILTNIPMKRNTKNMMQKRLWYSPSRVSNKKRFEPEDRELFSTFARVDQTRNLADLIIATNRD
jgi:hypothetical protein